MAGECGCLAGGDTVGVNHSLGSPPLLDRSISAVQTPEAESQSPLCEGCLVLAFAQLNLLLHEQQAFCKKLVLSRENKEDKGWATAPSDKTFFHFQWLRAPGSRHWQALKPPSLRRLLSSWRIRLREKSARHPAAKEGDESQIQPPSHPSKQEGGRPRAWLALWHPISFEPLI